MDSNVQSTVLIVNDGPYDNERPYNALQLALNLVERPGVTVRVFLAGDGVACARRGQVAPEGYHNVERIVKLLAQRGEVVA